jgi:hypothetical protein
MARATPSGHRHNGPCRCAWCAHIERCQASGWRPDADPGDLAAAWALARGITVLLEQGSLARHRRHATLDGVGVIVATLTHARVTRITTTMARTSHGRHRADTSHS